MVDTEAIQLVISDVDGTLITPERELTPVTIDAVGRLRDARIAFAVVSGRPARGMDRFVLPADHGSGTSRPTMRPAAQ